MRECLLRVVKVGGSLFELPDLADRLRRWLTAQSPAHHVFVAGGGPLVEQVRTWHASRPIKDEAAHWMCIDLLTVTAHLLHARVPDIPLMEDDRLLCQRVGQRGCTIFGPALWLRHGEPQLPGVRLPANWDVTSDSIAARLAVALQADELILLKSTLPESECDVQELSRAGVVDAMFPRLWDELASVRIVNMRADSHVEVEIRTLGAKGGRPL
jgi:aspartokinase-like uncharacterized kinase